MRAEHTPISRTAHLATTLLVLVQVVRLVASDHAPYALALLLALVVVTAAAATRLHHDNCVESRLTVSLLAVLNGGGVALAMTFGLPGQGDRQWDLVAAIVLGLSAAIVLLLLIDQARRAVTRRDGSPYAL
jgi:hypothetical protein